MKLMRATTLEEGDDAVWDVRPGISNGDGAAGDEGGSDDDLLPDSRPRSGRAVRLLSPNSMSDQERQCHSRSPREGHC